MPIQMPPKRILPTERRPAPTNHDLPAEHPHLLPVPEDARRDLVLLCLVEGHAAAEPLLGPVRIYVPPQVWPAMIVLDVLALWAFPLVDLVGGRGCDGGSCDRCGRLGGG